MGLTTGVRRLDRLNRRKSTMKPNFKDYLKATGVFVLTLLASISTIFIILLVIVLVAIYPTVALVVGLSTLAVFVIFFVVVSIHLLASTNARDRLDKDEEM